MTSPTPWYKGASDLLGLWSTKKEYFNVEFYALACIGTITNLVDFLWIDTNSSHAVARKI